MRFEGEEVKVVALAGSWVAAITSLNFLRIFSDGGLQVSLHKLIYLFQRLLVYFFIVFEIVRFIVYISYMHLIH